MFSAKKMKNKSEGNKMKNCGQKKTVAKLATNMTAIDVHMYVHFGEHNIDGLRK